MGKRPTKIISIANKLSQWCYDHYCDAGKCKCPFWDGYPYGHCAIGVPATWAMLRIKQNAQCDGNRN